MNEKSNDKTLDEKTLSDATGGWGTGSSHSGQCPDCPHASIIPYRDASGRMVSPCYKCDKRN